MNFAHFLAFDIGASGGRALLGTFSGQSLSLKEISRFPTLLLELQGRYYWDVYALYRELKESFVRCAQAGIQLHSAGIDTWGVDFGCIGSDGTLLGLPRSYRDPYTNGIPETLFQRMPAEEVYERTGIQTMNFNTLFQLYAGQSENYAPLKGAARLLFMPDLLAYMLTGNMNCEYTDASTSQLLNPHTRNFDYKLLSLAGISPELFGVPTMPGSRIGVLTPRLAEETGAGAVPIVSVAGHDTASAVAAVPAEDECFSYLSSGTWSLMGIETSSPIITSASFKHNFTNEGGIDGTIRFLKNITGMWLLEQCLVVWRREGKSYSYDEIVKMATTSTPFAHFIDPDAPAFASPVNMPRAISEYCQHTGQSIPSNDAAIIRCIFESLALRYGEVLELLQEMAPFPIRRLHIIGGGSRNRLLNQFTANAAGIPVIAGPSEASALGNVLMQVRAAHLVKDRQEMRQLAISSAQPDTFLPEDGEVWREMRRRWRATINRAQE